MSGGAGEWSDPIVSMPPTAQGAAQALARRLRTQRRRAFRGRALADGRAFVQEQ